MGLITESSFPSTSDTMNSPRSVRLREDTYALPIVSIDSLIDLEEKRVHQHSLNTFASQPQRTFLQDRSQVDQGHGLRSVNAIRNDARDAWLSFLRPCNQLSNCYERAMTSKPRGSGSLSMISSLVLVTSRSSTLPT